MVKSGIFILAVLYCSVCPAQSDSTHNSPDRRYNLKLSYNSSLIYPGLSTGIEFPIRSGKKPGFIKLSNNKSVIKERFIAGNLSWYHQPYFHDNLYLTAEWVMRRTNTKGFASEFSSGIGYSRTFLGGTTYRVSDNGDISIIKFAGYSYALITIGGGFSYDLSVKKNLPFSAFVKMNLISMFPYNSTIYFRPVMELGIRFRPKQLFNIILKKKSTKISGQE